MLKEQNMYHVKSFVDSYNAANEEPIVEFKNFLRSEGITEYLHCFYEIGRVRISHPTSIKDIGTFQVLLRTATVRKIIHVDIGSVQKFYQDMLNEETVDSLQWSIC